MVGRGRGFSAIVLVGFPAAASCAGAGNQDSSWPSTGRGGFRPGSKRQLLASNGGRAMMARPQLPNSVLRPLRSQTTSGRKENLQAAVVRQDGGSSWWNGQQTGTAASGTDEKRLIHPCPTTRLHRVYRFQLWVASYSLPRICRVNGGPLVFAGKHGVDEVGGSRDATQPR